MPKFSPLKLVDEAILPVVIVFTSKILVVFLVSLVFGIAWDFNLIGNGYRVFFLNFTNLADIYQVNSFSDLIMILATASGFVWIIFRSNYFAENNLHPVTAAKLHKKGQEQLIISSYETYHQAVVWLSLSWFVLIVVLNSALANTTSYFNLGIALTVSVVLTIALSRNSNWR